ncbi:hypothetical protein ANN_04272 [Periplaneta americana]|uniref:RNase H type-1 domain-containing protein n=1 Tax=Periplaneta americana TaxID=6978 RepID=A0ABQ8T9Q8_PERAM|nr:hypothetical protein ANN_04272 [Periplaneta americana]
MLLSLRQLSQTDERAIINAGDDRREVVSLLTHIAVDSHLFIPSSTTYGQCLGHMSDWDELNVQVRRQVDNDLNQLWTDTWLQANLLPHLLSSEVQIMIDKGTAVAVIQQIDEWLTDKDKSTYLSNHHSEELAAIYTIQGNTDRAWQQVERSVISFLNTWAELHPLSTKLRAKQLLDLQKFAELRSCLKFAKIGEQLERESQAKELLKRWNNNIPSEFDSLLHWDFRTMYRKKFSSQVQQILENSDIANVISHTELAMVDSALCQENFSVARKYLRRTKEKLVKYGRDMGLQWNLVYSKAIWLQGQLVKTSDKKLEFSLRSWDALDKVLADQNLMQWPMLHVETLRHVSVMVTGILQQLEDSGEEMNFTPESIQTLAKKINAPDCRIVFQWIPSHCGILGNENADALAKKGSTATYRPVTKSTYYSVKRFIKSTYLDFNKQNLITQTQGKKWNSLHQNPQLIPDLPRKSSVAAFRLATGHDCLAKHLHRIGIYQSPSCPLCNSNQEMDSEHLKICASLAGHDNIFEKYWSARGQMTLLSNAWH